MTKSFSVVTTTCVRSHFQTAAVATAAATTRNAAPATDTGQPPRNAPRPSSASIEARSNGRTRTTPCRRTSRQTCSSASVSMGFRPSTHGDKTLDMSSTAKRAAIATLVALSIVVAALALWKIRLVIALFFLGIIVAAAMRPGIEWLHKRARLPRGVGVLVHYAVLIGIVALFLWLVVPSATKQVQQAVGSVPTSASDIHKEANHSHGIKREILLGLQKRLDKLPSGRSMIHPAVTVTKTAFEVLIGIFFIFAIAAYWIFERDATIGLVQS